MQSLPRELFANRTIPNTYLEVNYYHMQRNQLESAALRELQGGHVTYYEQSDPGHPGRLRTIPQINSRTNPTPTYYYPSTNLTIIASLVLHNARYIN